MRSVEIESSAKVVRICLVHGRDLEKKTDIMRLRNSMQSYAILCASHSPGWTFIGGLNSDGAPAHVYRGRVGIVTSGFTPAVYRRTFRKTLTFTITIT